MQQVKLCDTTVQYNLTECH